jgi:hypothetical protein
MVMASLHATNYVFSDFRVHRSWRNTGVCDTFPGAGETFCRGVSTQDTNYISSTEHPRAPYCAQVARLNACKQGYC